MERLPSITCIVTNGLQGATPLVSKINLIVRIMRWWLNSPNLWPIFLFQYHHSALSRWCKRHWTTPARAGRASSWPTACPPSKTPTASPSSREEWWSNRGRINSCWPRRESTTCWSPNRWATGANKRTELFFSFQRDGLNTRAFHSQLSASECSEAKKV